MIQISGGSTSASSRGMSTTPYWRCLTQLKHSGSGERLRAFQLVPDGWGSHAERVQNHPRYESIFNAARTAFSVFQVGADPDGENGPLVVRHGEGEGADHFPAALEGPRAGPLARCRIQERDSRTRIRNEETFRLAESGWSK